MISRDYSTIEFISWDVIKPGDKLIWVTSDGDDEHYIVVFESSSSGEMVGTNISKNKPEYDDSHYSNQIYPNGGHDRFIYGWKLIVENFVYDPAQAGDTEEDI